MIAGLAMGFSRLSACLVSGWVPLHHVELPKTEKFGNLTLNSIYTLTRFDT
jgi:hypothetical protein